MSSEIVEVARRWIGTAYVHQASSPAGTDCLGLLRAIWRELYGRGPETVPAYSPDWSETDGQERLLEAAARHMEPVEPAAIQPGDALVFRMRDGSVGKHLGILARAPQGHFTFIHAYSRHGVVESPLTEAWARRIAGVFRFPDRSS
ncbi:NlpC/P60 family protein [Halovulum sp. GXIMD14793]